MGKGGALFQKGEDVRWVPEDEWQSATSEGWAPTPGQRAIREDIYGSTSEPVESLVEQQRYNTPFSVADLDYQQERAVQGQKEREFGGVGGGAAAFGLGVGRGVSFGLSDWLARGLGVEKSTLQGLQDVHGGLSTAGELSGVLGASLLPGGQGNLAKGLTSVVPAARATRAIQGVGRSIGGAGGRVTAEVVEGSLYGLGHGVGQLALRDEPLAAEALWQELGVNPIFGGLVGGTVGLAGAAGSKLFKLGKGKAAKQAIPDFDTPEGVQFADSVASRFSEVQRTAVDLADDVRGSVGLSKFELEAMAAKGKRVDDLQAEWATKLDEGKDQLESFVGKKGSPWLKERDQVFQTPKGKAEPFSEHKVSKSVMRLLDQSDGEIRGFLGPEQGKLIAAVNKARAATKVATNAEERLAALNGYRRAVEKAADATGVGMNPTTAQYLDAYTGLLEKDLAMAKAVELDPTVLDKQRAFHAQADELLANVKRLKADLNKVGGFKGSFAKAQAGDGLNPTRLAFMERYVTAMEQFGKHMGQPVDELADLIRGPVSLGGVMERAATKLQGDALAVDGLEKGIAGARKLFGLGNNEQITGRHIQQFLANDPQKVAKAVEQLNKQYADFQVVANATGRGDLVENAKAVFDDLGGMVMKAVDPEGAAAGLELKDLVAMAGITYAPDIEGPYDDMLKLALAGHILKKGNEKAGRGRGVNLLRSAAQRGSGRAAATLAANAARQAGAGPLTAAASGIAASTTYHGAAKLYDMIAPAAAASQAAGSVTSVLARTVGALYQGGGRAITSPGFSAVAVLNANEFGASDKPKRKDLRSVYEHRKEQILRLASDPVGIQYQVAENLAPVLKGHLGLGDKMIVKSPEVLMYMASKIPKDPGVLHRVGASRWKESDRDIRAFARHLAGATNPLGTLVKVANGTVSPQEAEAVRTLWPATFMAFQKQLLENLPAIQKKITRTQAINLSIVTGVPVDSTMRPEFLKFVQQNYVNQGLIQSQRPKPQGGGTMKPEPLTKAQSLSTR